MRLPKEIVESLERMMKSNPGLSRLDARHEAIVRHCAQICEQVRNRGPICDDLNVMHALHEDETLACQFAILNSFGLEE